MENWFPLPVVSNSDEVRAGTEWLSHAPHQGPGDWRSAERLFPQLVQEARQTLPLLAPWPLPDSPQMPEPRGSERCSSTWFESPVDDFSTSEVLHMYSEEKVHLFRVSVAGCWREQCGLSGWPRIECGPHHLLPLEPRQTHSPLCASVFSFVRGE